MLAGSAAAEFVLNPVIWVARPGFGLAYSQRALALEVTLVSNNANLDVVVKGYKLQEISGRFTGRHIARSRVGQDDRYVRRQASPHRPKQHGVTEDR